MAEGGESWWGSWLQSAKEKSSTVLEFMKRDVDEFTNTFHRETKAVVSNAANVLKTALQIDDSESATNKMKQSVSSFLGSVTQAFNPVTEENEDELCIIHDNEPVIMDRLQSQIYNLQINPKTYLEDPEPLEDYEDWIQEFDLETKQSDLSNILVSNVDVQTMYTKLVPLSVSHVLFWHRYFYKLYKVYEAEDRKNSLVQRANDQSDEDIQWDDEESSNNVEISEHLANQLLSDYEKECNERKKLQDENRNYSKNFIVSQEKNWLQSDRVFRPIENPKYHQTASLDDSSSETLKDRNDPIQLVPARYKESEIQTSVVFNNDSDINSETVTDALQDGEKTLHNFRRACILDESENVERVNPQTNIIAAGESETNLESIKTEKSERELLESLITKERGDLVVVARNSNDNISSASSHKEGSNDEEWEKDFDLEVTEEDIKNAQKLTAKENTSQEGDDDWENW